MFQLHDSVYDDYLPLNVSHFGEVWGAFCAKVECNKREIKSKHLSIFFCFVLSRHKTVAKINQEIILNQMCSKMLREKNFVTRDLWSCLERKRATKEKNTLSNGTCKSASKIKRIHAQNEFNRQSCLQKRIQRALFLYCTPCLVTRCKN